MGCSSSKHIKNNDQLRSVGSTSSPTAATNGGLSGITSTSRSSNNTSSRNSRNNNNNNYDDNISIPTIDSDYNPHNSNFSLSDAGGTVGSQSRLSHGLTISTNPATAAHTTISAFGSQLSPSIAPNDDEEEDSIERKLYQDVYMRESQNNMYSISLSHLIQPPTTTRTYNTATNNNNIHNHRNSYNHYNDGRGMKEETIIIIAPKGKLGVVIDTPTINNNTNTGKTMPIVHAIKDTCPIRNQIRVGDKLLAVDDEDVTYMTAVEVSRLIGRKSEQKERKLMIVRGGGGSGARGGVIY